MEERIAAAEAEVSNPMATKANGWSFLHRPDSNRRHFPGLILAVHLF